MNDTWKEFNKNELTHSAAHYLMAIAEVHEKQGYARLIDVSKYLDISKGSLSTSLKPLIKKNFINEDENKHLALTKKGQAFVKHIRHNYAIFKTLLTDVLQLDEQTAEIEACKIEHLLSGQTTSQLEKLLQVLATNPALKKELEQAQSKHCETYKKEIKS